MASNPLKLLRTRWNYLSFHEKQSVWLKAGRSVYEGYFNQTNANSKLMDVSEARQT